ncbi:hypothetical protein [Tardiphaga sp.]|uniref:hypothetical protein n=1 Tax=Tardiphaga sp. TaxID=1926292 RepID=UPI0037D9FF41
MSDEQNFEIENIVELYKLRITAALDQMPLEQVRQLVEEIEARIAASSDVAD